ncbi:MAG: iron-sulfur cluster assembly accessory protein [Betaproteobacteria bacterium]|jgi:iron-sulfur cluster assembly protein|nr:iron-sulfur cluster assembly accessory protein [Betaproteobacteria bacterium]
MAITLTESAAKHIQSTLANRGKGLGLRVGIKKVGCSGFAYTFDFADEIGANDLAFDSYDTKVVVDKEVIGYLDGSVLDFQKSGFGSAFKFQNPNVKAECGCGESFSVE